MFNLYGTERLAEWKKFRDGLELSNTPYQDVVTFWNKAPFVNPYLNIEDPSNWPDPWHLVLDDRFDDLAIALGMLYTLKLTRRFMESYFEIHMSIMDDNTQRHFLIVDDSHVLNFEYARVVSRHHIEHIKTNVLWSSQKRK